MLRKIVFILLALLMLGILGTVYLNKIFLPIKFKDHIVKTLTKEFNRPVSLGNIRYEPIKGIILENITILENADSKKPFINIREVSGNFALLPFIKEKTIIIPSLKIKQLNISLIRHKDLSWNFSDLLPKKGDQKKIPLHWMIKNFTLSDGTCNFFDHTKTNQNVEIFHNVNLSAAFSLKKELAFNVEFKNINDQTSFQLKGKYALTKKTLYAQLNTKNLNLTKYYALIFENKKSPLKEGFLSTEKLKLSFKHNILTLKGDLRLSQAHLLTQYTDFISSELEMNNTTISWQKDKIEILAKIASPSTKLQLDQEYHIKGSLLANLNPLIIKKETLEFFGNLSLFDGDINLKNGQTFKGNFLASDLNIHQQQQNVQMQANLKIDRAEFKINEKIKIAGDWHSKELQLSTKDHEILLSGDLSLHDSIITLDENKNIISNIDFKNTSLSYKNNMLTLTAQARIHNASANLDNNKNAQLDGETTFSYIFDPSNSSHHNTQGTLNIESASLKGFAPIDSIEKINGKITFNNATLATDNLSFIVEKTPINIKGISEGINNPLLNITLSSEKATLKTIWDYFPDLQKKTNIDLTGHAQFITTFQGNLLDPKNAVINASAQISDAELHLKKLNKIIHHFSADLTYKENLIHWNNLKATFDGKEYRSNGRLDDFSRPIVNMSLATTKTLIKTKFSILHSALRFLMLDTEFHHSTAQLVGDIHFLENEAPQIALRGTFAIDSHDLKYFLPNKQNKIKKLSIDGIILGEGLFKGQLDQWRDWQLTFNAQSGKLLIAGYPFEEFKIFFDQRDQFITKCDLHANLYQGEIETHSTVDLKEEPLPSKTTLFIQNINLAEFRVDQKIKNKDLAGNLSSVCTINTELTNPLDLLAEGSIAIEDGYLFQWKILEGLSSVLLIREFTNLSFTAAEADFTIKNQKIMTENINLTGDRVSLAGRGWVNFDKELQLEIIPKFSEMVLMKTDSLMKIPTTLLTQTDGYITIYVKGTLDNPSYVVEKSVIKIIEKTTDVIKEGVEAIFKGIF